ncbi:hypothetical protein Btru_046802 [Bulinus truncatus]|nr:hypothetical protein Btru_046802 [Bulinus truncatus]
MLWVAVDRYLYIVCPFVHRRVVTAPRANLLIMVQWAMSVARGYKKKDDPESKMCLYVRHLRQIAKTAKRHLDMREKRVRRMDEVFVKSRNRSSSVSDRTSTAIAARGVKCMKVKFRVATWSQAVQRQIQCLNVLAAQYSHRVTAMTIPIIFQMFVKEIGESLQRHSVDAGRGNQNRPQLHCEASTHKDIQMAQVTHSQNRPSVTGNGVDKFAMDSCSVGQINVAPAKGMTPPSSYVGKQWAPSSLGGSNRWSLLFGLFTIFWAPTMIYVLSSMFHAINYRVTHILASESTFPCSN